LNKEIEVLKAKVIELENEIKSLKEKIKELTKKHAGGRPQKFSDYEKELICMYRMQGKSFGELSKLFKCSVGVVHKIVKNKGIN
jgi:predicted  nucleic acid-binding Zn-ribbon protein